MGNIPHPPVTDKKASSNHITENNRSVNLQLLNFQTNMDLGNTTSMDDAKLSELLNQFSELKPEQKNTSITTPILFQWPYGGKSVFVTGSFNNWKEKIQLQQISSDTLKKGKFLYAKSLMKSGVKPNTYYAILDLPVGKYFYKFIVDDKWMIDKEKPIIFNNDGIPENMIEVKQSDFSVAAALENDELAARRKSRKDALNNSISEEYNTAIPGFDTIESLAQISAMKPAPIPPYLDQKIVHECYEHNTDAHILPPPPNHVIINHLLTHAIKDNVIMMSVISRYREKFVTTVFCKPAN